MGVELREAGSALIKVNLASPAEPGQPRTDLRLLADVIQYVSQNGAHCAIAEGANGFLRQNIDNVGLGELVEEHDVAILDLDLEEFDCVTVDDEKHYLPKCLKDYPVRVGVPSTSKRPGMIFSNNVKLFVGAVPRHMYQLGEQTTWRPRVHIDLHKSVANIYRAIMMYAPFRYFVNGGNTMIEGQGEFNLCDTFVGTDGLELDCHMLLQLGVERPEYIKRLLGG